MQSKSLRVAVALLGEWIAEMLHTSAALPYRAFGVELLQSGWSLAEQVLVLRDGQVLAESPSLFRASPALISGAFAGYDEKVYRLAFSACNLGWNQPPLLWLDLTSVSR